jgi:hypothetical protein
VARKDRNNRRTRAGQTPEDRDAVMADYRDAVDRFQRSAFWNLRTRIANVNIVIGVLALVVVATGGADGGRLVPTLVCVLGGVCGGAVYFSRPYPQLVKWLLVASVGLTVLGIIGLVVVVGMGE